MRPSSSGDSDTDAALRFSARRWLPFDEPELRRRATIEGEWAGRVTGLRDQRVEIAMMHTPDGHNRLELSRFLTPPVVADHRNAPVNALGYLRVMFTVEDIDDTLARLRKRGAELFSPLPRRDLDRHRLRMHCLLAYVNCKPTKTGVSFTREGAWEYDQMSGTGRVTLGKDGRLKGTFPIKDGDSSLFIAVRARRSRPSPSRRPRATSTSGDGGGEPSRCRDKPPVGEGCWPSVAGLLSGSPRRAVPPVQPIAASSTVRRSRPAHATSRRASRARRAA